MPTTIPLAAFCGHYCFANPYTPPTEVQHLPSIFARNTVKTFGATTLFVVGFIGAVHADLFVQLGTRDAIATYANHNWVWNNFIRLPYLACIQFVLIFAWCRVRTNGCKNRRPSLFISLPLGAISGVGLFRSWDLIGSIIENQLGVAMTWAPHFMACWIAYGLTSVSLAEALLAIRRFQSHCPT
ncbi:hypothetical protein K227x_01410 [Rubripirellula lacrimiformis]|uniref:Uncharacterized protein n=1 Tax=Rubripirellula lacrimiformis TaxID=1930273 RepID=A0A517N3R5_9BACT|nr:hypothetical protein K227x_01410 [Rubripirellula lacrimiformis]